MEKCPMCGVINDDDWPITVGHEVIGGGCQTCWETECDAKWWEMIEKLNSSPPLVVKETNEDQKKEA